MPLVKYWNRELVKSKRNGNKQPTPAVCTIIQQDNGQSLPRKHELNNKELPE